ncbi:MAG TPA: bifunctional adenosylcobinamide kinase/adenosylcobinamide-phosphate guanylyltransferase [Candidatus Tripitaka californicus]|uniref:bifunctional adenosylcobinamide kinase/adenosylcobinamide-phosphate guanylyltransferase n=1 Tax=Candidatus Tripitaka californicus TaxID=3367616 RepID=UPI004029DF57|nr:bifunctional adenosylcobinamide kinase/adenosylcobinamide-phosphate guanylyltransferase [Planctomycetota bacterium]
MAKVLLVLGGARSGKSAFAVNLARGYKRVTYLATARVQDAEMAERVKRHRQIRPASWQTIESPSHADKRILELEGSTDLVLLDCLTLYVTNLLLDENQKEAKEAYIIEEIEGLCQASSEASFDVIMVSNEVGQGIIPADPMGRQFMDIAGLVNQQVAREAEAVYFLIAGMAKRIK